MRITGTSKEDLRASLLADPLTMMAAIVQYLDDEWEKKERGS